MRTGIILVMENEPSFRWAATAWDALLRAAGAGRDLLDDGAWVARGPDGLLFSATPLNAPEGWRYPFLEPGERAQIGQAVREADGRIVFELMVLAAGESVQADYEGSVGDMDDAEFEIAYERALAGTPAERRWLIAEFSRLMALHAG